MLRYAVGFLFVSVAWLAEVEFGLDDSRFVQLNHGLVAQVLLQPWQRVEGRPHRRERRCLRSATRPIRNPRWNLPSFCCRAQTMSDRSSLRGLISKPILAAAPLVLCLRSLLRSTADVARDQPIPKINIYELHW